MVSLQRFVALVGIVMLCASACGLIEAESAVEEDAWVLMMAERHPAIADITELDSGTRTSAVRTGGTININYRNGVTHAQTFAPTDTTTALFDELTSLLETSGYERGEDVLDHACFSIEYEAGETDAVYLVTRVYNDDTPQDVTLRIAEQQSCG